MTIEWVDTHAHLDQEEFAGDFDQVLHRALQAGVVRTLVVGVTAASSARCCALAAAHPQLSAAVGIQPNYTHQSGPGDWDQVARLARAGGVAALGETGLDCYWKDAPLPVQQDFFDRHLRLSQELDLPFIVHTRESDAEVLEMLRAARRRGPLRGVMHSFSGAADTAAECVALGMHVSFAGMLTFKKSTDLRSVAAGIPHERLLVETDSPYLAPQPVRGKRNEPANVVHTGAVLAEATGLSVEKLAAQTTANARELFRWL